MQGLFSLGGDYTKHSIINRSINLACKVRIEEREYLDKSEVRETFDHNSSIPSHLLQQCTRSF